MYINYYCILFPYQFSTEKGDAQNNNNNVYDPGLSNAYIPI